MKGNLIAQGNTAEVFEWSDNKILKLFRADLPASLCLTEFSINQELSNVLSNLPQALETITIGKRVGIIYERLTTQTLLKLSMMKLWNIKKYGKEMARLHIEVHQKEYSGSVIPKMVTSLSTCISEVVEFTDVEKEQLLNKLTKLPTGHKICHFDFHPDNIIYKEGKIIDWLTCCIGNPLADVARTSIILEYAVIPRVPAIVNRLVAIPKKKMNTAYLQEYLRLSGQTMTEISDWYIVVMAARLRESLPPEETAKLLRKVKQGLKSQEVSCSSDS